MLEERTVHICNRAGGLQRSSGLFVATRGTLLLQAVIHFLLTLSLSAALLLSHSNLAHSRFAQQKTLAYFAWLTPLFDRPCRRPDQWLSCHGILYYKLDSAVCRSGIICVIECERCSLKIQQAISKDNEKLAILSAFSDLLRAALFVVRRVELSVKARVERAFDSEDTESHPRFPSLVGSTRCLGFV